MPRPKASRASAVPTKCLAETLDRRNGVCLGGKYLSLSKMRDAGLDHTYISRIMRGMRMPSYQYGRKIALAIGVVTEEGKPDVTTLFQLIEARRDELEARHIELTS